MLRLALCGPQRSGKSTVAKYLAEEYGAHEIALAAPIKGIARDLFGMQEKNRGLLIEIGETLRAIDPLVYCRYAARHIPSTTNNPSLRAVVISDIRTKMEAVFFMGHGFIPIAIHADVVVRATRPGFDAEYINDPTESEADNLPTQYTIYNTGSLQNLYTLVDHCVQGLGIDRKPWDRFPGGSVARQQVKKLYGEYPEDAWRLADELESNGARVERALSIMRDNAKLGDCTPAH